MSLKLSSRFFLVLTFLVFGQNLRAQVQSKFVYFSGFVIDSKSDQPLPGAFVMNQTAGKGTYSNDKGYFILDVFPGDSIVFSYVGFKKQFHKVPRATGIDYSAVVELNSEATLLREVKVYPFRTEEEFKTAFLTMELDDQADRDAIANRYNVEYIRRLAANQAMGSMGNYRYGLDMQRNYDINRRYMNTNPLTNPFAIANFIKSVKNGSLKDKNYKEAEYIPAERGTRDQLFKAGKN
ncbi:MAG: carboxypeptidase-like regulatory domain-containing protein [Leadbetterella sp.]